MIFPRRKLPDGKEHSQQYLNGYSAGLSAASDALLFADAYICILERRLGICGDKGAAMQADELLKEE